MHATVYMFYYQGNWKSRKAGTGTGTGTGTETENWERSSGALVIDWLSIKDNIIALLWDTCSQFLC